MAEPPIKIDIIAETSRPIRELMNFDKQVSSSAANTSKSVDGIQGALDKINNARIGTSLPAALQQTSAASRLTRQQMMNLGFQVQDLGVQFAAAAGSANPLKMVFTALIQQGSQIQGIGAQAGLSFKQMGVEVLKFVGILKTVQNAEAAAAAADAATNAKAIAGKVAATEAAIVEADAELAVAMAQRESAVTANQVTAANARLAAARQALAAAGAEQAIAEKALAGAQQQAAITAQRSAAGSITSLSRLGVIGLSVAAVIGTAMGAAAIAAKGFNDEFKKEDAIKKLGLTAQEAKKLKDTSITMGDTMKATFQVIGKAIWDEIGDNFDGVGKYIKGVWKSAVAFVRNGINYIIAGFVSAVQTIQQVWSSIPAVVGDAAISAANSVIDAVNSMVKGAVSALNGLIDSANSLPLVDIGRLDAPSIGRITNSYAGAAKKAAGAFSKNFKANRKRDFVGEFGDAVGNQANKNRDKRLKDQAKKIKEDRTGGGGSKGGGDKKGDGGQSDAEKAAEKYADAIADLRNRIQALNVTKDEAILLDEFEKAGLERNLKLTGEKADEVRKLVAQLKEAGQVRGAKDAMKEYDDQLALLGKSEAQVAGIEALRRAGFETDAASMAKLTPEARKYAESLRLQAEQMFRINEAKAQATKFGEMMTGADQRLQDLGVDRQAISDPAGAEKRRQEIAIERAWLQEQKAINDLKVISEQELQALRAKGVSTEGFVTEQMRQQLYLRNDAAKVAAKENVELERKAANAQLAADMLNEGFRALMDGKQAMKQYFKELIAKLIAAVIQAALLSALLPGGGGGFGAQFTKALGFRAGGGSIDPNRPYVVGEKGPELFMPGRAGQVVRNSKLSRMGGGGGATYSATYNFHASGNAQQDQQSLAQLKNMQREEALRFRQNERAQRWR